MNKLDITRRGSLSIALGGFWAVAARAAESGAGWGPVEAAATALIADHAAPGLSISIANAGRLVFTKGFGLANLETLTPAKSMGALSAPRKTLK